MKLRHLFAGLVGLAAVLGVAALAAFAITATKVNALASEQRRAQFVAREVSAILALTQEYVLHAEERAVQQWRKRFASLNEALTHEASVTTDQCHAAPDLLDEAKALPVLFDALVALSPADTADSLKVKRRELFIDRLLSETQAIAQDAYQWEAQVAASRAAIESRLIVMAITLPALLALLFAGAAWLLARRILKPIGVLQGVTAIAATGDFSVRCDSSVRDEVGDLARGFDHMANELQISTRAIKGAEAFLRSITDNLPVRIAYVDRELRYRFVNELCCEQLGRSREEVIGRTLSELASQANDPAYMAQVTAVLGGEGRRFEFSERVGSHALCIETSLVPDLALDGTVKGFFSVGIDVTERKEQQARIEATLREKETLLKEIHHRVKNNMQVISSLLQLQASYIDGAETREVFNESQARIKSMALVHEKLYQTVDLAQVDFADYVHSLVSMLVASNNMKANEVAVDVRAQSLKLDIERAIPAGLILNELVSNSFKHAFPLGRAGRLEVTLATRAGTLVMLAVRDDGVGPPETFDPTSSPTLGLRLVHILSGQLGATLSFHHDKGFACELTFDRLGDSSRIRERETQEAPTAQQREKE